MIPLRNIVGQIVFTVALAGAFLGLLSVLGFPTQRMVDVGRWLQVRLVAAGSGAGLADAGRTATPTPVATASEPESDVALIAPPALYAVAGGPVSLQHDNVVLSRDSERFRFGVICKECSSPAPWERRRWTATAPGPGEVPVAVGVSSIDFKKTLGFAGTVLRVAPADALRARPPRILIFGDSITRQHWWVNGIARRLEAAGVRNWSMLGREYSDGSPPFSEPPLPGVRHEAEYGWSFTFFATFVAADESQARTFRRPRSPFVAGATASEARLDVPAYYRAVNGGAPADFVIMQAGINDIWGVNVDDPVALAQRLDTVLGHVEKLADAFRSAYPGTHVGVLLPAPFTRNERQFDEAYKGTVTRWNTRRAQHALVRAMIDRFKDREKDRVWLLPLYATFDTIDGYPIDNAGHPNAFGQNQIADVVYDWMNWVAYRER